MPLANIHRKESTGFTGTPYDKSAGSEASEDVSQRHAFIFS